MINWFRRRKCRKLIKEVFTTAQCFILECNKQDCEEIIAALQDVLTAYANKYGKDDIYYHYIGRLEYFKLIGGWKK